MSERNGNCERTRTFSQTCREKSPAELIRAALSAVTEKDQFQLPISCCQNLMDIQGESKQMNDRDGIGEMWSMVAMGHPLLVQSVFGARNLKTPIHPVKLGIHASAVERRRVRQATGIRTRLRDDA